jgi:hypothetical protein
MALDMLAHFASASPKRENNEDVAWDESIRSLTDPRGAWWMLEEPVGFCCLGCFCV